jgi:CubicO group peptidase (beta-lactamase class C family)
LEDRHRRGFHWCAGACANRIHAIRSPATGFSNAGFIELGLVIEHVSGESYYAYVREHIFKPAGMNNTDNYKIDEDVESTVSWE